MSEEFRKDLIQRMKETVLKNKSVYTITPDGIDFVVKNEDILRFNEGTTLKYNLPAWSLPIFEKHILLIRNSLEESRTYPFPRINKITMKNGIWYIKFDSDNLSIKTLIRIDELCDELEKSMLYSK